jgi:hypothetical protein
MAEKALEAMRKGESLDGIFAQQREQLKLAEKPRKNVVSDLKKGKGGEDLDDETHVV